MKEEYFVRVSVLTEGIPKEELESKMKSLEDLLVETIGGRMVTEKGLVAMSYASGGFSDKLEISPYDFVYKGDKVRVYTLHFPEYSMSSREIIGGKRSKDFQEFSEETRRKAAPLVEERKILAYGSYRVSATDIPADFEIIRPARRAICFGY